MRLGELAAALTVDPADAALDISGLAADSRDIRPGFLFAALRGDKADGTRFVGAAVAAGAAAVLAGRDEDMPDPGVPVIRADDPRRALALMAARFFPRQPDRLVAVTGTSGKTSVAEFARQIFAAAGHPAASIGTLGVIGPEGRKGGGLTTPDPVRLQRQLDELARGGVTHAALEASSHGLDQRRLDGLRLAAAGFTNLGRDHMDYHATVDAYLAAKRRLFEVVLPPGGTAVVDTDSEAGRIIAEAAHAAGRRVMAVGRGGADIRFTAEPDGFGQRLRLQLSERAAEVRLPLAGTFQASNAVMALGLTIAAGIDADAAIAALEGLRGAPGRLEKVAETEDGAAIFVDYAHKPEAVQAALSALRPMTRGRLIVVIGAGGDRDPGKRPLMGRAAAETADIVVVTDDNPRSEDPAAIRAAILEGAPGAIEIAGRGRAIGEAVAMLRPGDVLCVAGKGHETGQEIKGEIFPFSDREAVLAALRETAR